MRGGGTGIRNILYYICMYYGLTGHLPGYWIMDSFFKNGLKGCGVGVMVVSHTKVDGEDEAGVGGGCWPGICNVTILIDV